MNSLQRFLDEVGGQGRCLSRAEKGDHRAALDLTTANRMGCFSSYHGRREASDSAQGGAGL